MDLYENICTECDHGLGLVNHVDTDTWDVVQIPCTGTAHQN